MYSILPSIACYIRMFFGCSSVPQFGTGIVGFMNTTFPVPSRQVQASVILQIFFPASYQLGRCSSLMSARHMLIRYPPSRPPTCPHMSMWGARLLITISASSIPPNQKLSRPFDSSLSRCQVRCTSENQTPSKPNADVEAPTASLYGSTRMETRLPKNPQNRYRIMNFLVPSCSSMPKPTRLWKNKLKKMWSPLACNIMGVIKRHTSPLAILGPQLAPNRYNEHVFGDSANLVPISLAAGVAAILPMVRNSDPTYSMI
mmetsp:Transcript_27822/g.70293  ORF Transcript_27822/g.70293 Transcript_27822/m.70293 type:complete len:258 (-) Transcript_27822:654-1427(-)